MQSELEHWQWMQSELEQWMQSELNLDSHPLLKLAQVVRIKFELEQRVWINLEQRTQSELEQQIPGRAQANSRIKLKQNSVPVPSRNAKERQIKSQRARPALIDQIEMHPYENEQ
jgi:hypothetical protein